MNVQTLAILLTVGPMIVAPLLAALIHWYRSETTVATIVDIFDECTELIGRSPDRNGAVEPVAVAVASITLPTLEDLQIVAKKIGAFYHGRRLRLATMAVDTLITVIRTLKACKHAYRRTLATVEALEYRLQRHEDRVLALASVKAIDTADKATTLYHAVAADCNAIRAYARIIRSHGNTANAIRDNSNK